MPLAEFVFWACAVLLFFTYAGYALILLALVKLTSRVRGEPPGESACPLVSVILVVRNEQDRIESRLRNLLETSPPLLVEVWVACDGCTDNTAGVARGVGDERVRILELSEGRGKPAGLNAAAARATGEVLAFCDARQRFAPDAITRLASWFSDASTGAVSGALEVERSTGGAGQGVDAYWRLEKWIRQLESDLDSSVGCTGAIYALRRELYQAIPEDTILDDVVLPMQAAAQGYRIRFDGGAIAWDPQQLSGGKEVRRKIRTLRGNFQMLARFPGWLLPWRHRLWWQVLSHKYLRLAGPFFLIGMLIAAWLLKERPLYAVAWWVQCTMYTLALASFVFPKMRHPLVTVPGGFLFLQWCVVRAGWDWLFARRVQGWK